MKKRIGIMLAIIPVAAGLVLYRLCDGWTIIEMAARLHSQWGSTNCGHVTNSQYHGETTRADAAITCAQTAYEHRQPFKVIFTGYGNDEEISNTLVANSEGRAIEVFYATGMVTNGYRLLRHRCDLPTHLVIEKDSPYGFPQLHCAEWPPKNLDKDFLLW
jgi:hypothetical protein